jgi:hypothetical protein
MVPLALEVLQLELLDDAGREIALTLETVVGKVIPGVSGICRH